MDYELDADETQELVETVRDMLDAYEFNGMELDADEQGEYLQRLARIMGRSTTQY